MKVPRTTKSHVPFSKRATHLERLLGGVGLPFAKRTYEFLDGLGGARLQVDLAGGGKLLEHPFLGLAACVLRPDMDRFCGPITALGLDGDLGFLTGGMAGDPESQSAKSSIGWDDDSGGRRPVPCESFFALVLEVD